MKTLRLAAWMLVFGLMGCSGADPSPISSDISALTAPASAEMFRPGVDHRYFPLWPGSSWIYEGDAEGRHRRDEVRVLEEPRVIAGIRCTAVLQEVYLNGGLSELTHEWYAQDRDGNVWKFGEESLELDGAQFMVSTDSWEAGRDGAEPWLILSGDLRVGHRYVGNRADGQDEVVVESLSETVTVPAGTFEGCLQVVENPDEGGEGDDENDADEPNDTDIILYAPGTGMVSEESANGRIVLVGGTVPG